MDRLTGWGVQPVQPELLSKPVWLVTETWLCYDPYWPYRPWWFNNELRELASLHIELQFPWNLKESIKHEELVSMSTAKHFVDRSVCLAHKSSEWMKKRHRIKWAIKEKLEEKHVRFKFQYRGCLLFFGHWQGTSGKCLQLLED